MADKKGKSRSANIKKLHDDLRREVAELVSEYPSSKIAILFNDPSSESGVPMNSICYPNGDGVVKTFLQGSSSVPVSVDAKDGSSQERWWEDEKLYQSDNVEELKAASESMEKMLLALKKSSKNKKGGHNNNAQP